MAATIIVMQLVIALGIVNVWTLRLGQTTAWRGGNARTMKEEFAVYGLPMWFMGLIGFLKLLFATMLVAGIWIAPLTRPAAIGMAVLMLGAVTMHLKVKDPARKSLPAACVLVLCVIVAVAS